MRKGKQCRERWINHLDPNVKKGPFLITEDIKMVEVQLEVGNRWAYISTFLKGRTENQVKNRFKTLIKKYVLGTYGKSYYDNYVREISERDEHESLWKSDKIVNELLELKRQERDSCNEENFVSKNMKILHENLPSNEDIPENNVVGTISAFKKVSSNFAAYSRNATNLHTLNSQPIYLNHSLDYLQEGKNLNYESINLNNSMNSKNSGIDQLNSSMNNISFNNGQKKASLNLSQNLEESKEKKKKSLLINSETMINSTVPRASINLMQDKLTKKESQLNSTGRQ